MKLPTWEQIQKKSITEKKQVVELDLTPDLKIKIDFCASRMSVLAWNNNGLKFDIIEEHDDLFGFHEFPSMKETFEKLITEIKPQIMITSEQLVLNGLLCFNPESNENQRVNVTRNGKSLTKGKFFIVPEQEDTNASILTERGTPILLQVDEVDNNLIITRSHGSFTKEICWGLTPSL